MPLLEDLAREPLHSGQKGSRKDVIDKLIQHYGHKGDKGWSLTEVLRMDRRFRGRLLDLLGGVVRGKPNAAPPYPGRFKIKTVDGEPMTITKIRPTPDEIPAIVDGDGIEHYDPRQWGPVSWDFGPEAEVPFGDSHNPANCATWLLLQYGWGAREGGSNKRRWGDKKNRARDRWRVYEEAYRVRNPKAFAELKDGE